MMRLTRTLHRGYSALDAGLDASQVLMESGAVGAKILKLSAAAELAKAEIRNNTVSKFTSVYQAMELAQQQAEMLVELSELGLSDEAINELTRSIEKIGATT